MIDETKAMRTQVVAGGGPARLLLSQRLHRQGIDSVMFERQSRAHVFARIRAGVIVPPIGYRGLNLAASDVYYPWQALRRHYHEGDDSGIENCSATVLSRAWKAKRFSWRMTRLLHRFPEQSPFDLRMQRADSNISSRRLPRKPRWPRITSGCLTEEKFAWT